jgi:hypothetical protein
MLDKEVKRELPEEWKEIVPTEVFLQEAETMVEEAGKKNIVLRIMGGLGVAIHCKEFRHFAIRLGRIGTGVVKGQEYSDIDFVSYRKHRNKIRDFFSDMGYAKRKTTLSSAASERQIYYHPKGWFYVKPTQKQAKPHPSGKTTTFSDTTTHPNAKQRIQQIHNRLHI